jgi:hypothetical protein
MHELLGVPDVGALASGLHFAAGAIVVVLVQCVIVAAKSLVVWWRATRALEFPPDNPTRIWGELKELRAECATSATNLETVVAQFKDAAMAQMGERAASADRLRELQQALDERAATILSLEQEKAELELVQEQLVLQLQRKDGELGSRSAALVTAEETIALLQGLIGSRDQPPRRAAG